MNGFRVFALFASAALAAAAVGLLSWWARISRLPAYDRPAVTWQPRFRPVFAAACVVLCAASCAAAIVAHPAAGLLWSAGGIVALGAVVVRRSESVRARVVRARFVRHAGRAPADADPLAVRAEFVRALHPEWGPDLAGQIAADCADADALGRWIARVERHALVRRRG